MRAAIYARVSTEEQAEAGTSLEEQVRRCTAYCAAHDWTVVAVHREEGVSGARASRPELDKLMRAARRGELDAIVVAKLDRWGRSMRHLSAALGDLDDWHIRFASVAEAIDSSTPSGRLLRNVLGAIAEFEREAIIERTSSGLRAVARGGWWPGGPPPYGYRIERLGNRSRLVINDDEADTIRTAVVCLIDRRMTTWQTAAELNALGLPPRRADRWNHHNLRRMLLDARGLSGRWPYRRVGRKYAGGEITLEVPSILTVERHEALRAVLAQSSTGPGATARRSSYLLVGRITSACGGSMHGTRRPDRGTRIYRCINRRPEANEQCACRRCPADALEAVVWAEVVSVLTNPQRLFALAEAAMTARPYIESSEDDDLAALDRRIRRLEHAVGTKVAELLSRGMDVAVVNVATLELEQELARLREHRSMVASWHIASRDQADRMQRLWSMAKQAEQLLVRPAPELQKRVLDLLNVRVHVTQWERCAACDGKGFVSAGLEPGSRSRGATGRNCETCARHRFLPIIEIAGVVPDASSLNLAHRDPDATTYPFQITSSM